MQLNHCLSLHSRQRGVALITAMLVAVLVTAGAVAVGTTQRFSMQRGFNQIQQSELTQLVYQGENQAKLALGADMLKSGADSLDETWAIQDIEISNHHSRLTGKILDRQALFNLTNLAQQFGAGTRVGGPSGGPQTPAEKAKEEVAVSTSPNSTAPITTQTSTRPSPLSQQRRPADARPSLNNPALPEREVFDWRVHQDFVDSYVSTCDDANYACAEQAIRQAYQQSITAPSNPTTPNQNENTAAVTEATPGSSAAGAASSQLRQGSASMPTTGNRSPSGALTPQAQLSALFRALDLDLAPVQAILDWIDEDSETRYPNGAEDEYYTGLDSPYRTANGPFATVRELLLVRGITPEVFEKLEPYICVLPKTTPININTAEAEVLMAIHPMIGRTTAELLIDARKAQTFQTRKSFMEHPALFGISLPESILTTSSEYFSLNATASTGDLETYYQTLMQRMNSNVSVLRRAKAYLN